MRDLRGTILVVEDDDDIRESLVDVLDDEGFAAVGIGNCAGALELLRASDSPPALILLDLMMPGMSTADFRMAQGADPKLAGIPVVIISAALDLEEHAAELKPTAVLQKPMKAKSLLHVVRRHGVFNS